MRVYTGETTIRFLLSVVREPLTGRESHCSAWSVRNGKRITDAESGQAIDIKFNCIIINLMYL